MKVKKTWCVAAFWMLGMGQAYAQSSVTLYGILDVGASYANNVNGHSKLFLDSGVDQHSIWGLTGREDIGGGLSGIFKLEGGYSVTNGASAMPGEIFDRIAYVGLASNTWGSIKLGNDFDYLDREITFYTNVAQFASTYSFHLAWDVDRLAGESVNNAIDYETPDTKGFKGGVMYGFSNVAGAFGGAPGNPRVISAGLSYAPHGLAGPFSFGAAYTQTDGGYGTLAQLAFGGDKICTFGAGARAQFGKISVNGVYTYTNQTLALGQSMITSDYELGMKYSFAPDLAAGIGYSYLNQTNPHQKYGILSAGTTYRFSKQTSVYMLGSWQRAFSGTATAGNFLVVPPGPNPNGDGFSTTGSQAVVQVGIQHVF
jgi:predicted porin